MRLVDKGESPEVQLKEYQDALPHLEKRIGLYCSYCEMPIKHVPEVEHIEAKSSGGAELEWTNLLLSCKYCNTRKGTFVKAGEGDKYLWPDRDDTFHAFSYQELIPEVNSYYLKNKNDGSYEKAIGLYQLLKLDNEPRAGSKDRRFFQRNEARNNAKESRRVLSKMQTTEDRKDMMMACIRLALATGFFSVWMYEFQGEEEFRRKLVEAYIGTRKPCFTELFS